jgi:hypothetical protein
MARTPSRSRQGTPPKRGRGGGKPSRSKAATAPRSASKTSTPPISPVTGKPLSEAYWRRLLAAKARGAKTTQEARGHRQQPGEKREHIRRRERELAEGETTYQRGVLKRFGTQQAGLYEDGDIATEIALLHRLVREHGWDGFLEYKAELDAMARGRRPWRRTGKNRKVINIGPQLERANAERGRNIARQRALSRKFGMPMKSLGYHRKARGQR